MKKLPDSSTFELSCNTFAQHDYVKIKLLGICNLGCTRYMYRTARHNSQIFLFGFMAKNLKKFRRYIAINLSQSGLT